MARQGKFARLPHSLREEVCRRLLNGESSGTILAWLNVQPGAVLVWDTHFEGAAATPQNLSEWRLGGYKDWLRDREKVENTKTLAAFAAEIAGAGGNISSGLQAILGGHILEGFEVLVAADEGSEKPDSPVDRIAKLGGVVASMRNADTAADRLELDKEKVKVSKAQMVLAREKFEKQTVQMFMKYAADPKMQAILGSRESKGVKMDQLHAMLFGHGPQKGDPDGKS